MSTAEQPLVHCPPLLPAAFLQRTLSRPMWMRSLVRKALGLKEDELKAFFIKASAKQKQHGAAGLWQQRAGHEQRACSSPRAVSCLLPYSGGEHRRWDMDTGIRLRGQLALGMGWIGYRL